MKIYNEIVIDMNPESLSYGETLHEDSFEYEGDLMLMQNAGDIVTVGAPKKFYGTIKDTYSGQQEILDEVANPQHDYSYFKSKTSSASGGTPGYEPVGSPSYKYKYPEYEYKDTGTWEETGNYSFTEPSYATLGDLQTTSGEFTYTADPTGKMTFDPTSSEFQESVEEVGGYQELIAGFDLTDYQQYFDDPNLKELGFLEQEQTLMDQKYGEGGTELDKIDLQRDQIGLDIRGVTETERATTAGLDIDALRAEETKRAGETQYGISQRQAGLRAGETLFDIKRQTESAGAGTGFAGAGGVGATGRRAQRGVMADYKLQQEELASGLKGVQSAFDISQQEIASGRTSAKEAYDIGIAGTDIATKGADIATTEVGMAEAQGGIDYKRSLSQFWDTMEDKFYSELTNVETLKNA